MPFPKGNQAARKRGGIEPLRFEMTFSQEQTELLREAYKLMGLTQDSPESSGRNFWRAWAKSEILNIARAIVVRYNQDPAAGEPLIF